MLLFISFPASCCSIPGNHSSAYCQHRLLAYSRILYKLCFVLSFIQHNYFEISPFDYFLLLRNTVFCGYITVYLSIHLLMAFKCFQFWAMTYKVAVNVQVRVFVWKCTFISLGCMPNRGMTRACVSLFRNVVL